MHVDFSSTPGRALVTGGTGGIGRAVCRRLAAAGSDVILTYRSREAEAAEVVDELRGLGVHATALRADLTDADDARAAVDASASSGLHTVVYASGPHVPMTHLSRVTPEQFAAQLNADATAFFHLLHPALAHLRSARGSLVAVTTAATRRYPVRDGLSSGPKGAVEQLVKAVAAEEGRYGVRANCVGPGMLTDGMAERLIASGDLDDRALAVARGNIPLRRFGDADDIAAAVTFLASDLADFVSGQTLDVDGGYGV